MEVDQETDTEDNKRNVIINKKTIIIEVNHKKDNRLECWYRRMPKITRKDIEMII